MPIPIRYTTTNVSSSVRLGDIALGVNAVDYGPSTTTGFTNGVSPLNGGYVIYYLSGTDIRMRTAVDDATLTTVAGQIMGTTYTSVSGSLIGLTGGGFTPVSVNPPNTVTSGSVLNLNAGLVMSYPKGGNTWYDISGNSNNGTLINGPTFNNTNNSLAFDGTDDNVSTSYNSAVAFLNTSPYTLEVLVNAQSQINYPGFMNRESNVGLGRDGYNLIYTLVGQSAGQVFVFSERFTTGTSTFAGFTTATSSFFNNWHHVLSTYDGSMVRIYYDGVLQGSGSSTGNITNASKALEIANRNGAVLKGNLSYARVYNRALSQSEILQNYYQGNIVTSSLTMALDAGNLVSYPGSGTAWTTLTGSNSGTLTNGPTFNLANGGVIVFDGVDDTATTTLTNTGTNNTTQIVWYKWNGSNQIKSISYLGNGGADGFGFLIHDGSGGTAGNKVGVLYGGVAYNALSGGASATLTSGVWCQLAITRDSTTTSLYQNGNLIGTTTSTPAGNSSSLTFAANIGAGGSISSVLFYTKALSATEIAQNFNAQRNRFNI